MQHIELVRSESRDTPLEAHVYELGADDFSLIVKIGACEDMEVENIDVRVEVPEADMVVTVQTNTKVTISDVMQMANVPSEAITKVTYNGARVLGDATLHSIHFANRSALVVYVVPAAPTAADNTVVRDASTSVDVTGGSSESGADGLNEKSATDAGR